MADEPLLTITLHKSGDSFQADLEAPSGLNGVADLRLRGIRPSAVEAIEVCLAELQAKAADGDEIALRFAVD
jgi:hypothetical protein